MTTQTQEAWIPEWTFGDRLRKVRRERKLSQATTAQMLGVAETQIASWETAGNNPRDLVTVAKKCQMAFGVPVEWMLGLDAPTLPTPTPPDGGADQGAPMRDDAVAKLAQQKLSRTRGRTTDRYLPLAA